MGNCLSLIKYGTTHDNYLKSRPKELILNVHTLSRAVRHPSDFSLLPITEFQIFLIKKNIHIFFKLLYRKEDTPNY